MRFQHRDPCAERIVKAIARRFNPKHDPDDREIEKENDVGHGRVGKRDRDNGGAAGDGPVGDDVESLPPDHDSTHLAAIKVRHRIDVARIVKAALERNRRLLTYSWCAVFSCHGCSINWITEAESNNSCFSILSLKMGSLLPLKHRRTWRSARLYYGGILAAGARLP